GPHGAAEREGRIPIHIRGGARGVVAVDLRDHVHCRVDDAGAQRRRGPGGGGSSGEGDLAQRAILAEQGELQRGRSAHTSASGAVGRAKAGAAARGTWRSARSSPSRVSCSAVTALTPPSAGRGRCGAPPRSWSGPPPRGGPREHRRGNRRGRGPAGPRRPRFRGGGGTPATGP